MKLLGGSLLGAGISTTVSLIQYCFQGEDERKDFIV